MTHNLAAHADARASVGAMQRSSGARRWLPRLDLIMRHIALIAALLACPVYANEECGKTIACGNWSTKHTYPGGTLRLNWTHVYEGRDTLFRIDFPARGNGPKQLKVEGQPVFDARSAVVALPYCADDGCAPTISFVDLLGRRVIGTANLPHGGQFYMTSRWQGDAFIVRASIPDGTGGKDKIAIHRYRVTRDAVVETR